MSQSASEEEEKGGHSLPERPRDGSGERWGRRCREGTEEGRGARAAGGRRRWQGEKEELEEGRG